MKETGAGISREAGLLLRSVGVKYVDVAGSGGTSWTSLAMKRRGKEDDPDLAAFTDWGIPTAAALCEVSDCDLEVIASSGIRTGLDVARCITLGARMCGLAALILRSYFTEGEKGCFGMLESILNGLKTAMVLTGSSNLKDLKKASRVIKGPLRDWVADRKKVTKET